MDLARKNTFKVVGRLQSQDLKTGNKKSNGDGYIYGKAVVIANLAGEDNEFEISFLTNEKTKDGKVNQLYVSYSKLGDLVGKKVEISGEIRENRFWSTNGNQMSSAQQLSGKFVRGVSESTPDEGSFEIEGFVVEALKEKTNKDNEIYRYDLTLGQANYSGNNMSRFVLHVNPVDTAIVRGVQGYQVGQTVRVQGDLRFIVKQVRVQEENAGGFGTPATKVFMNKQRNFFITMGTAPYSDPSAGMYSMDVIRTLVAAYKARDVELANKAKDSGSVSAEPVEQETKVSFKQASLI